MATNSLSKTDEIILNYNMVPLNSVDEIKVIERDGKQVMQCVLKEPESCKEGGNVLTKYRRRRYRSIQALGIANTPLEVVFCWKYFNKEKPEGKRKTIRCGCPDGMFYTEKGTKRYARSVYLKVIELHRLGYNNMQIVRCLQRDYGVGITEGEIRRMLKFKGEDIKIPELKVRKIGIDELKIKGTNIIATALLDIDRGLPLGIVKGKKIKDIKEMIKEVEEKGVNLNNVEVIMRDLYKQWDTHLTQRFPNAIILVDGFHAVKRIQKQLYDNEFVPLRKEYLKKAEDLEGKVKELKKKKAPEKRTRSAEEKAKTARHKSSHIFKSRFLWRKGEENIKTEKPPEDKASEKERLDELFEIDAHFKETYALKEKFRDVFKSDDLKTARQSLNEFKEECKDEYKYLHKTAVNNEEYILNGFTNKGKMIMNHYPEELIGELKRIQRIRGSFRAFDSWGIIINIMLEFAGVTGGLTQQHDLPQVVR